MSFFDEDDEPRTRVRPAAASARRRCRRPRTVRPCSSASWCCSAASSCVLALLIFVIDGCRDSARESALKDYNRDVASIVRDSDSQVGKPFFDLLRNPSQGDLSTLIAGYKVQADSQYQQAKRIDTPGDMTRRAALVPDRDGDAPRRAAVGRRPDPHGAELDAEAADKAIEEIAGAMSMFLSSDVIYTARACCR